MRQKKQYDVTTMIRRFLNDPNEAGATDLRNEIKAAMIDNNAVKDLISVIGGACMEHGKSPVDTIAAALLYGMVIGIQLEKDRTGRYAALIVPKEIM